MQSIRDSLKRLNLQPPSSPSANPGPTTAARPTTPPSRQSSTATRPAGHPDCPTCRGLGFYTKDVPVGHPDFGAALRCTCNADYRTRCGLTADELHYTAAEVHGDSDAAHALRALVAQLVEQPAGMLTLWGSYGAGKSACARAIVAGLVRAQRNARFVHAKQLEQHWFSDMDAGTTVGRSYRDVPYLAIDELDKVNLKSDWVKQQFQELLDHRYRLAVGGAQLTIITLQSDPETSLPGDIASRLADGRFYRPWLDTQPNRLVVDRWGVRCLPGILHIQGPDARPYIRPAFAR